MAHCLTIKQLEQMIFVKGFQRKDDSVKTKCEEKAEEGSWRGRCWLPTKSR